MKTYLPAGEIVNTHGVRGEVRVLPWADSPEFLLDFKTLYIDGAPVAVESARVQKTCVLLKLAGVDGVEAAQALRGKQVMISRADAKLPDGAVFVDDLIGMKVLDQTGEIGVVTDVWDMPRHDVYIVKGEREYQIPAVKEFVKKIDVAAGVMQVVTIEGMASDAD